MKIEMHWVLEGDDGLAGEMTFAATNRETRERFVVAIMLRQRYRDDLIVQEREYFGEIKRTPVA